MTASCIVLSFALDFRFVMPNSLIPLGALGVLWAATLVGKLQKRPMLRAGATAFLQMTLFTLFGVVLSYAMAACAGPLWDARLGALDQALGFNLPAILGVADRLGGALWLGGLAYHSLTLQMILCIVVLSATGQVDRLRISVTAAIASGFVTIIISGVMPALGNIFDPEDYRHLWPSVAWRDRDLLVGLRDGSWRIIDLAHLTGIVTFPSYHAALPVILTWATVRTPGWRLIMPVWATLTVVATPLFGGHYAVDVLAGAALGVLALRLAPAVVCRSTSLPLNGPNPRVEGSSAPVASCDGRGPRVNRPAGKVQTGADHALV